MTTLFRSLGLAVVLCALGVTHSAHADYRGANLTLLGNTLRAPAATVTTTSKLGLVDSLRLSPEHAGQTIEQLQAMKPGLAFPIVFLSLGAVLTGVGAYFIILGIASEAATTAGGASGLGLAIGLILGTPFAVIGLTFLIIGLVSLISRLNTRGHLDQHIQELESAPTALIPASRVPTMSISF